MRLSWESHPEFGILVVGRAAEPASRMIINHCARLAAAAEFVGESVDKALAAKAFPAGQLDKAERVIIDHAARPRRLDKGAVQNHLGDLGFFAALDGLRRGPAAALKPFRRPGLAQAEEGLLHVMGVLRERDEVREEIEEGTRGLQLSPGISGLFTGLREDGAVAPGRNRTSDSRTSTEDLDRDGTSYPRTGDRWIGQCVTRARVLESECDRWIRWQ